MSKNRSKRLRKKLYVDEFEVLGFEFTCAISSDKEEDHDNLIDGFIGFIEENGLTTGAGLTPTSFSGFVTGDGRYDSATDEHRNAVEKWLTKHPLCSDVKVSELVNAN